RSPCGWPSCLPTSRRSTSVSSTGRWRRWECVTACAPLLTSTHSDSINAARGSTSPSSPRASRRRCLLVTSSSVTTARAIDVGGEARRNPELRALLAPMRAANGDVMHRLVRDAVDRGELAAEIDPRALEDLLNSVLAGLARFSSHSGDAERHARAVDVLKRFI